MTDPSIHDSFVCEIIHRLEDRTLIIFSHYRDSEIAKPYFTTEFTNVVGHHFDHVVAPSILLDILPLDVATVIEMNKDLFADGLGHNWPFHGPKKILQELANELSLASINGFQVMGYVWAGWFRVGIGLHNSGVCRTARNDIVAAQCLKTPINR